MAYSGVISDSRGLSAKEIRKTASGASPGKFKYEPGTTPEALEKLGGITPLQEVVETSYGSAEFRDFLGSNPLRISPSGNVTILPQGTNPFEHPSTARDLALHEKVNVVSNTAWKAEGWKVASRAKGTDSGDMLEWDSVVLFSLTRAEAAKLSPEELEKIIEITVDEVRQSQRAAVRFDESSGKTIHNPTGHGKGFKDIIVLPLHADTGNIHIQAFVNRVPWNYEDKAIGAVEVKSDLWDNFRDNVNIRLSDAGIDLNLARTPDAVLSRRADMEDVNDSVKALEEAGIDVHPELTVGAVKERVFKPAGADELEKAEADLMAEHVETMRRARLIEASLKQVQGAKGVINENAKLKEDLEVAGIEISKRDEAITKLEGELDETGKYLSQETARADQKEALSERLSKDLQASTTLAGKAKALVSKLWVQRNTYRAALNEANTAMEAASELIDDQTRDIAELQAQRQEAIATIEMLSADKDGLSAQVKDLTEERDEFQNQAKIAGEEIEALSADSNRLRVELEAQRQEATATIEMLSADKDGLSAQVKDLTEERDVFQSQAKIAGEEIEGLLVESNRLRVELEAANLAVASMKAAQEAINRLIANQDSQEEVEPEGDGLRAQGTSKKAMKAVDYPEGVKVSKNFMSRMKTLALPDGSQLLASSDFAKLTKGKLTDEAIEAMAIHAEREGWVPVEIVSSDEKTREKIAVALRARGLMIEGEAVGLKQASTAPEAPEQAPVTQTAQRAAQPRWWMVEPSQWNEAQTKAAQAALNKAQGEGKFQGISLKEFGDHQNKAWTAKNQQNDSSADNGDKPKPE